ncbi:MULTISPECIES: hypothetical protein [unclassified Providencia]|uniref:hypothetical protein n=1 Tax=unclassified Providencia TaxID=2633465 RepID=UPI00234B478D|nr:hypothetical protein [Providencia sp. PROV266]
MKKYLLPISLAVNVILLASIIFLGVNLFNIKNKIDTTIEQVKSGQYSQLIKDNTGSLVPEGLKNFNKIEVSDNKCDYFDQKFAILINYLEENPTIPGSNTYVKQLNKLKITVEKSPSALKETACDKGISSINYIGEKLSTIN